MIDAYYFLIPKRKMTMEILNCSTAKTMQEVPTVRAKGWFKTTYCVVKVPTATFEAVTYFDKYQAYDHAGVLAQIAAIGTEIS